MKIKTKIERYPEDVIEITSKIKPSNLMEIIEMDDVVSHFEATVILEHLEFQIIRNYVKATTTQEIQEAYDIEDVIDLVGKIGFEDLIEQYENYKKKKIKV